MSWQSMLQKCVAISTIETEYIIAIEVFKKIIQMINFLLELGYEQDKYVLRCNSQSVIRIAKNSTFPSCLKYIDVRYHWIWEVLENELLHLEKIYHDKN